MLVIGLTGGIASGKSTVAGILKSYGIPIIDLDQLARKVVEPGSKALRKIRSRFPNETDLINPINQTLNRERLGQIIFNDPRQRKWLDGLLHPIIRRSMIFELLKLWLTGCKMCVVDSPLLVETGMWKFCGKVIVVYCSEQLQIQRLKTRNPELSNSDAKSRISSQLPLKSKLDYGDHIIDNSGTLNDLDHQIERLVWKFEKGSKKLIWLLNWLIPPIGILNGLLMVIYKSLTKPRNRKVSSSSSSSSRGGGGGIKNGRSGSNRSRRSSSTTSDNSGKKVYEEGSSSSNSRNKKNINEIDRDEQRRFRSGSLGKDEKTDLGSPGQSSSPSGSGGVRERILNHNNIFKKK